MKYSVVLWVAAAIYLAIVSTVGVGGIAGWQSKIEKKYMKE